jgi:hypothetical protein
MLKELAASPLVQPTSPFVDLKRRRGVTWLEPKVAVEVQYNDLTGGRLRAPVLRAIVTLRGRASHPGHLQPRQRGQPRTGLGSRPGSNPTDWPDTVQNHM